MLHTGPQDYVLPEYSQVDLLAEGYISVLGLNDDGQADRLLAHSADGRIRLRTETEVPVRISVDAGRHWSLEVKPRPSPKEILDPTPVEIPEGAKLPETLEEKLKRMLAGMVVERYGRDSDEVETFEEAMDFDIPDDPDDPMSGYEVQDMEDLPPPVEPEPEPDPEPQPPDTSPPEDPKE